MNLSLFEVWGEVSANLFSPYSGKIAKPDVSLWLDSYLLLNKKAFHCFKNLIVLDGEILPITVNREEMYIFNCMRFCKEDPDLCSVDLYGMHTQIGFDESDIANKVLFKSELLRGSGLFATQGFMELYETSGFTGLTFSKDLCSSGIN